MKSVGWVCAALAVSGLAACGGGGGGDKTETLYVSFGYGSASVSVRQTLNLQPDIDGLGDRVPRCAIAAGALPPGVVLGSNCAISGAATAAGTYDATVRLTSSGVKGFVDASTQFVVDDPTPTLAVNAGNDRGLPGQWRVGLGGTLDAGPLVQVGGPVPRAGDVLTFHVVDGGLPGGMVLNDGDGSVDGSAQAYGTSGAEIVVTLRRNGVDYTSSAVAVTIDVLAPALGLSYGSCDATWGVPVSCLPTITAAPIAGSTLAFSAPGVPLGFAVDGLSGALYGTPATLLRELVTITAVWTLPDGDTQVNSVNVSLRTSGPVPLYLASAEDLGVASGPDASPDGLGGNVVGLVAGQAFEIPVDLVSGARDGDDYGWALVQSDPNFPLPAWVSIDAQGTLRGTPPPQAVGVPQYWTLRFIAQRAGQSLTIDKRWTASVR